MDTNGHIPLCEDYVSFETAKLLADKGFNEECRGVFYTAFEPPRLSMRIKEHKNSDFEKCVSVPTHQMAMAWLRKKGIIITIDYNNDVELEDGEDKRYGFCVYAKPHDIVDYNTYLTYEEACEAAIRYCLENLI